MFSHRFRFLLPLALLAALSGCSGEKDRDARAAIHSAGYAFSVDEFLRAASEGKAEIVSQFLKAGMNPDAANGKGLKAIQMAAARGHGHVVALLRDSGALPMGDSPTGQTALMEASRSGDEQAVKVLLAAGAKADARDDTGMSPLSAAVMAGHTAIVALLLQGLTSSLDPALQLAAMEGHTPVMAVLLDKGASPHATSVDGRTPMMYAAQYGRTEAVKLLRQRGASVTALDEDLKTAADLAEENGHDDLAAYLREPDKSADEPTADSPAPRLPEVTWSGPAPASLESLTVMLRMVDYRTRRLPIVVEQVLENNGGAHVRVLTGKEETYLVMPGAEIPRTGLKVESMRRRFTTSKLGQGRLVDISEVRVLEESTGRHYLAVKDLPAMAGEGCAVLKVLGTDGSVEAHRGDVFTAGELKVKVTDVRPSQIVLERTDTKETATLNLGSRD